MTPKILVVDDSKIMRRIIRSFLNTMDCLDVFEAASVRSALEIIEEEQVDLIISDYAMPGMNGLEFLKCVRRHPDKGELPFIMITAEAQLCLIFPAFREGANDYITKPFTREYLEYVVRKTVPF